MSVASKCEKCGGRLPAGVLSGRCPRCFLMVGLDELGDPAELQDTILAPALPNFASIAHPARIARYRIVRLIGEGGMGAVYEAEQEQPRRTVALKVIKPGIATPELLKRFEQESQALGRLQHPGIAQIYEAG